MFDANKAFKKVIKLCITLVKVGSLLSSHSDRKKERLEKKKQKRNETPLLLRCASNEEPPLVENEQECGEDIESKNDSVYCHSKRNYHSLYEYEEDSNDDAEFVPEKEVVEEEEEYEAEEDLEKNEAVIHNFEDDDFVVDAKDPSMQKGARYNDVTCLGRH